MASRSLIVMPDDAAKPILEAIAGARGSLRVKMFVFSDPSLLAAVADARRRGVDVRVMLNPARRSGEEDNEETRRSLSEAGVEVIDSYPGVDLTHEKSMVVDESTAFVKSLNWATKNLTETRDYAVVTNHRHEVEEILRCFEADWERKPFDPGESAHLVWCPVNGRDRIARFIDAAKHTLFVQNERYQDAVILERIVRAARRGVKVHVMARPPHALKKEKLVEGVGGLRIGNWPSRCTTATSSSAWSTSRSTTGNTPTRSICRTKGCSRISTIDERRPRPWRSLPRPRRVVEPEDGCARARACLQRPPRVNLARHRTLARSITISLS